MIHDLEIDGVRALYAETDGLSRAGLVFRVGQADETLPQRGITHLVEHLALFPMNLTDYHSNGTTGQTTTHFYLEGSQTDLADFLGSVCKSLSALPVGRIERERAILQTEEAGHGGSPALPGWRYGAQGYGLVSYAEWGNEHLGADAVLEWARTWFTRENAVLWVAGPRVPEGIRLPLPSGSPCRVPDASSTLPVLPAWFASGSEEVVMDTVVPRTTAAATYAAVLGRELFRVLRQEGGWSYRVGTQYDPRDATHATVTAYADAHAGEDDAVLGAFVDVLARLRAGRIDETDLQACRTQALARLSDPDVDSLRLPGEAADLLYGRPLETVEKLREEVQAVTAQDVRAVAKDAHGRMLLKVPWMRSGEWTGFAEAPAFSAHTVEGRRFEAAGHAEYTLVVGLDGVTYRIEGRSATVRFADCAVMLLWPDGRRVLIGRDGFTVTVEPTLFTAGFEAVAFIDTAVDRRLWVHRPARDDEEIPVPPQAIDKRERGRASLLRQTRRRPVPDAVQRLPVAADPETTAEIVPSAPAWRSLPAVQGELGTEWRGLGLRPANDPLPQVEPDPAPGPGVSALYLLIFSAFVVTITLMVSAVADWPGGGVSGAVVRGAWVSVVVLSWISFAVERSARRRQ